MLNSLPKKVRQMWNRYIPIEQQAEIYDAVKQEIDAVSQQIETARTHIVLDGIRDGLKSIKIGSADFNHAGTDMVVKRNAAIRVRIAREAFEDDGRARKARSRIDGEIAQIHQRRRGATDGTAFRDGLHKRKRGRISEFAYGVNGYLLVPSTDKKLSDEYYLNEIENFTPTEEEHAENQGALFVALNQGANKVGKRVSRGQCPSVSIIHNYDNNHKRGGRTPESVCPLMVLSYKDFSSLYGSLSRSVFI